MFLVRLARRACVYVRQHKKLFIIGGLLCAGVGFGGWYVRRKLDKLKRMVARQEVRMNRLSKLLQLNDMRTAHLVKSSLQEVRQNLLQRLLDVDHLVRKARSAGMSPEEAHHAQQELQHCSFARIMSAVYLLALLRVGLGVLMAIQGKHLMVMMEAEMDKEGGQLGGTSEQEEDDKTEQWLRSHFPGESSSFSLTGTMIRHLVREDGMLVLSQAVLEKIRELNQDVSFHTPFKLKEFFAFIFSMRTSIENLHIPSQEEEASDEPLSQFCVGFDELVLPPTNRLESQSPVVLEMAEELRELVRSDEFQICFTETCDDLFGTLVPAIKKFFATAVASLRDGGDAVPLMLLVPPVANEAWTVLNSKDDNPYFEKVMRSASPMRMNQFLMLSIFKPEDFELGSHLPFLSAE